MNILPRINDFFKLFYPSSCEACSGRLVSGEICICSACWHGLPRTGFHCEHDNLLTRIFRGRVSIESGTALFYYHKGGKVQNLIHRMKYKRKPEIGHYLGMRLGHYLAGVPGYMQADCIVPVPLHAKRLRERGFNQSEAIAQGISGIIKKPVITNSLLRTTSTQTQTRKRRFTRWENVETVFTLAKDHQLENKRILLVDDVITTGSTLEACAGRLLSVSGVKLWIAAIGVTI